MGPNFMGKFGARAARQAPGTPASHTPQLEEHPHSPSLALHAAWPRGARRQPERLPKASEDGRERPRGAEVVVVGVIV